MATGRKSACWHFRVPGAETDGMIGYLIEQELENALGHDRPVATLLTQVEVDPKDPAFARPTKFIGPVYDKTEADRADGHPGLASVPAPARAPTGR